MTFRQLRIVAFALLASAVIVTTVVQTITLTSVICALVSLGGAAWIAFWLPPFIVYAQEKYGIEL